MMPSASFNHESAARSATVRMHDGALLIDQATRQQIESKDEPRWAQFLRLWESLAAAKGRYPARSDVDPMALGAKLLPNVFLVDVLSGQGQGAQGREAPRFRFRLLGQAIIDREPTRPGAFLEEIGASADIAAIAQQYTDCLAGKIWIRDASLAWSDPRGGYLRYRVMMLPLSEDGSAVSHLIGLVLYEF